MTSWNYDCIMNRKEGLFMSAPKHAKYIERKKIDQKELEQEHREWLTRLVK